MKITNKELAEIEKALYRVAAELIKCENSEDEKDRIYIKRMEYQINELIGENRAFALGYKQEV